MLVTFSCTHAFSVNKEKWRHKLLENWQVRNNASHSPPLGKVCANFIARVLEKVCHTCANFIARVLEKVCHTCANLLRGSCKTFVTNGIPQFYLSTYHADNKMMIFFLFFLHLPSMQSVRYILTLKAPRKSTSENVVCLCRLLHLLANFSNLHFAYRQTVLKEQSDLGPHCLQQWLLK